MKKFVCLVLSCIMLLVFCTVAFASDQSAARPSAIIAERVDVPMREAMSDSTFVFGISKNGSDIGVLSTQDVHWNVWGEKDIDPDSAYHYYRPLGYSEHCNGDKVLNTYHYTRTFLGSSVSPRGDSDREWGYGTVKATGTGCSPEVWDTFVHRVYYGTTDD